MISWFGRTPDHFTACQGRAEVRRTDDGWVARIGSRIAGPFSCLDAAMDRAAQLFADAERAETA